MAEYKYIVKSTRRYLTSNFRYIKQISQTDSEGLRIWKSSYIKDNKEDNEKISIKYDSKNCIYCANPTYDLDCYYNYLVLLNKLYPDWVKYGMFDIGYKPYLYFPSFWTKSDVDMVLKKLTNDLGIGLHEQKSGSFMYLGKAFGPNEYWIKDSDLRTVMEYCNHTFGTHIAISNKNYELKTSDLVKALIEKARESMHISPDIVDAHKEIYEEPKIEVPESIEQPAEKIAVTGLDAVAAIMEAGK